MRRTLGILAVAALTFTLGVALTRLWDRPRIPAPPEAPLVITQLREVARLETLDVTLFKKVSFAPEPTLSDSTWGDVKAWVKFNLAPSHGKAIVFADAHLGLRLDQLDLDHVRLTGSRAEIVLPPLICTVSLRPADTEVMDSNLNAKETTELLELARKAFEREVMSDPGLQRKAKASAERSLGSLLRSLGFREVVFVDALPRRPNAL